MTHFKTFLMTAALMAVPSFAVAQISTDAATNAVKEKAVDSVMENMTTEDAVVAGTTMLKGGSKEDAAIAVVKNRADAKIEAITGGVSVDEYSTDGVMDAGKDMALQKATGSATRYTDGVSPSDVSGAGGLEAGKAMALEQARAKAKAMSMEKAEMNGKTWGLSANEKAKMKITSGQPYVIQKSGSEMSTMSAPTPVASTLNCPAGTKDAGDGTCMITGDWKP